MEDVLEEIYKQINAYRAEHSEMGIITCDLEDVYEWLKLAEKKVIKKRKALKFNT